MVDSVSNEYLYHYALLEHVTSTIVWAIQLGSSCILSIQNKWYEYSVFCPWTLCVQIRYFIFLKGQHPSTDAKSWLQDSSFDKDSENAYFKLCMTCKANSKCESNKSLVANGLLTNRSALVHKPCKYCKLT